mmetsp:Transcript_9393/g.14879  ORF Transcript_9393/g.14879 Transcript_9393/m.14879 type:complete len:94 (+) Transcript_9393:225-506(+)
MIPMIMTADMRVLMTDKAVARLCTSGWTKLVERLDGRLGIGARGKAPCNRDDCLTGIMLFTSVPVGYTSTKQHMVGRKRRYLHSIVRIGFMFC